MKKASEQPFPGGNLGNWELVARILERKAKELCEQNDVNDEVKDFILKLVMGSMDGTYKKGFKEYDNKHRIGG